MKYKVVLLTKVPISGAINQQYFDALDVPYKELNTIDAFIEYIAYNGILSTLVISGNNEVGATCHVPIKPTIKFNPLAPDFELPTYSTPESAAFDLRAHFNALTPDGKIDLIRHWTANGREIQLHDTKNRFQLNLMPGERCAIPLGFSCEIEPGYELNLYVRSGMALKSGIMLVNGKGIVDADYRGPVKAVLYNSGANPFRIDHLDRIVQAEIHEVTQVNFEVSMELSKTERGEGGFGHSGMK